MRRPPRPVQIPKVPDPVHRRRASLRMILVAGAISALILSGNLKRAEAESAVVASEAVPVQLQAWPAPGDQDCAQAWSRVEPALHDCLYDWWLVEPEHAALDVDWQSQAMGGSTLGLSELPPPAVQSCLNAAMEQASPGQSCHHPQRVAMPPL